MSAEAVRTAIGEDGIEIAVNALKEVAQIGTYAERMSAATTLLSYGLAYTDAFGNEARA